MAYPLKELLHTLLQTSTNDWKISLLMHWSDIVGALNNRMTLEKIEDTQIIIGVYDSCWMQELYLLSPMLLATINEKLDYPRIKQLRFKKAVLPKKRESENNVFKKKMFTAIVIKQHEQRALEHITDPILRQVLKDYLVRCYRGEDEK